MTIRLLYVEDDDDLRRLLAMMLVNEGYDVVSVASAEDAIVELQSKRYDLLLTDYNLENKNADWMLKVAQASGALRETAVVILTAEEHPQGVDGYRLLKKPVDVAVLFAALDATVSTHLKELSASCGTTGEESPNVLRLTLYITSTSRESKKAVRNLNRVLSRFDGAPIALSMCDVASAQVSVESLEADRVVVTPTLVRSHPLPKVWVFGDLSKTEPVADMIATGLDALAQTTDVAPRAAGNRE